MKGIMLTIMLCLCVSSMAWGAEATIKFSWEHDVPSDMGVYTIYQLTGSGGAKTDTRYVVPYIDGTVPPFMSQQQVTIPCDTPENRCYVITAKDIAENESADSNEACAVILVDCAPVAPREFTVEFPVVAVP